MTQTLRNSTPVVQKEQYETPLMEVIEMETEGSILTISGEDGTLKPWQ